MAEPDGPRARLLKGCGLALVAAGRLIAVGHVAAPDHETVATIIATEAKLVAAHVTFTLTWLLVLLGLPGLYRRSVGGSGRFGLAGS